MKPLTHRILRRIARDDRRDYLKTPLLLAASLQKYAAGERAAARRYWRFIGLVPSPTNQSVRAEYDSDEYFERLEDENYKTYIRSASRLIEHLPISRSDTLADIGCGRGLLLAALEAAEFENIEGFDIAPAAVARAVHPHVHLLESLEDLRLSYRTVALISILEHIPYRELDNFLHEIRRVSSEFVAACIPTYPENMLDFFDVDPTHVVLERRSWWDAKFARHGFAPLPLPEEPLEFIMPFLYRKR